MPTVHEFEDAAVDYCLNTSGVGVWAMRLEQVTPTEYDITIRLGGRYRAEPGGVAVVRVTYHPQQQHFTCQPAEPTMPDLMLADDLAYEFT